MPPKKKIKIDLTVEERTEIVQRLAERGVKSGCRQCDQSQLQLFSRITYLELQTFGHAITYELAEQRVPAAVLLCPNCGWLSTHALGPLDLQHLQPKVLEDE